MNNKLIIFMFTLIILISCVTANTAPTQGRPILGAHFDPNSLAKNMTGYVVAYYPFENNASDASDSGNNATMKGANFTQQGAIGGAYTFSGNTGSYIDGPHLNGLNNSNNFTFVAWIKNAGTAKYMSVGGEFEVGGTNNGFRLNARSGSGNEFWAQIGTAGSSEHAACGDCLYNDNKWHQIIGVYNSTNIAIFFDGTYRTDAATTRKINTSVGFRVGWTYSELWNGSIDEVIILNRSLSKTEIASLYNSTKEAYRDTSLGVQINTSSDDDLGENATLIYTFKWFRNQTLNASSIQPDPNLVLYLPMNYNSTTSVNDYSGSGITGIPSYVNWTQAGKIGGAYVFSTPNDSRSIINMTNYNSLNYIGRNSTFEAWVYSTNFTDCSFHAIFGKHYATGGWFGLFANTGRLQAWFGGLGTQSNGAITTNKWYHVAAVWNGTYVLYYINGTLDSAIADANSPVNNTYDLTIGQDNDGVLGNYTFTGTIDEFAIYNRTLSAAEINQQYIAGLYNYENMEGPFFKGENWTAEVNVIDVNGVTSNAMNTSVMKILNTPPVLTLSPLLTSTNLTNKTLENLSAINRSYVDDDKDTLTFSYSWFMNDTNQSRLNNNTIIGDKNTTKHDIWKIELQAFDGTDYSNKINSTNLTILNTIPYLSISPILNSTNGTNKTTENITAYNWSWYDPDDDQPQWSWEWFKFNSVQLGLNNNTIITFGNLSGDDIWIVQERMFDGEAWSNALNSTSLLINNGAQLYPPSWGGMVSKVEESDVILGALIILPMLMGIVFAWLNMNLEKDHSILKILFLLLSMICFFVSMSIGGISLSTYYPNIGIQNFITTCIWIFGGVFFAVVSYFIIYAIWKMTTRLTSEKEERMTY